MGSNYYSGERINDKTAKRLISMAAVTMGVSGLTATAVLGAAVLPTTSNFAICTEEELVYLEKGGFLFKPTRIHLSDITAISTVSPSFGKLQIVVTVGGSSTLTLDIPASIADANAFYSFLLSKR